MILTNNLFYNKIYYSNYTSYKEIKFSKGTDSIKKVTSRDKVNSFINSINYMNNHDGFIEYKYYVTEDDKDIKLILITDNYISVKDFLKTNKISKDFLKKMNTDINKVLSTINYHGNINLDTIYYDGINFYLSDLHFINIYFENDGTKEQDLMNLKKLTLM